MSLQKCTDCKKKVSSQAGSCPNCGAPVVPKKKRGFFAKLFRFIKFFGISLGVLSLALVTYVLINPTPSTTATNVDTADVIEAKTEQEAQELAEAEAVKVEQEAQELAEAEQEASKTVKPSEESLLEVFNTQTDFTIENNRLEIVSEDPPHVIVRDRAFENEAPSLSHKESKRAFLTAAYRTLFQTGAEQATITSEVLLLVEKEEGFGYDYHDAIPDYTYQATITKEHAEAVLKEYFDVDSLADAFEPRMVGLVGYRLKQPIRDTFFSGGIIDLDEHYGALVANDVSQFREERRKTEEQTELERENIVRPNGEYLSWADATVMCNSKVRENLISPRTAKFVRSSLFNDDFSEPVKMGNTWNHEVKVDSENTFGALLRSHWLCVISGDEDTILVEQIQ